MKYFVPILFPLEVLVGLMVSSFLLQEDEILKHRGWFGLDFHLLHWCSAQHLTSVPYLQKHKKETPVPFRVLYIPIHTILKKEV